MKNILKQFHLIKHCLKKNNRTNIIPDKKIIHKDKDKDIKYYLQVLLEKCSCKVFLNNRLIHPRLKFSDTEPILNQNLDLKKSLMKILCDE